jgi:hypothetical protein
VVDLGQLENTVFHGEITVSTPVLLDINDSIFLYYDKADQKAEIARFNTQNIRYSVIKDIKISCEGEVAYLKIKESESHD